MSEFWATFFSIWPYWFGFIQGLALGFAFGVTWADRGADARRTKGGGKP